MQLLSKGGLVLINGRLLLIKGWLVLSYVVNSLQKIVMLVKLVKVKVGFCIVKKCHYYNKYIYIYLIVSRNSVFHFQV